MLIVNTPNRLNIHAKMLRQRAQSAFKALTNRFEFPFAVVAIDFAKNHRGFHLSVFRQIKAGDFHIAIGVHAADKRAGYLPKVLLAGIGIVDGYGDGDFFYIGGHGS